MRKSFCPIRSSRLLHVIRLLAAGNDRRYYLYHLATNSVFFLFLTYPSYELPVWDVHGTRSFTSLSSFRQSHLFMRLLSNRTLYPLWNIDKNWSDEMEMPSRPRPLIDTLHHARNQLTTFNPLTGSAASVGNADHKNIPFSLPAPRAFLLILRALPRSFVKAAFFAFIKISLKLFHRALHFSKVFQMKLASHLLITTFFCCQSSTIHRQRRRWRRQTYFNNGNRKRNTSQYFIFFSENNFIIYIRSEFTSWRMRKKAVTENGQKSDRKRRWQKRIESRTSIPFDRYWNENASIPPRLLSQISITPENVCFYQHRFKGVFLVVVWLRRKMTSKKGKKYTMQTTDPLTLGCYFMRSGLQTHFPMKTEFFRCFLVPSQLILSIVRQTKRNEIDMNERKC